MAESSFNAQRQILLSDEGPSYWYWHGKNDHRFNTVNIDENGITAVRIIEYLVDIDSDNTIHVSNVEQPLYLVFIDRQHNENGKRTEIHRQYVKIKWE